MRATEPGPRATRRASCASATRRLADALVRCGSRQGSGRSRASRFAPFVSDKHRRFCLSHRSAFRLDRGPVYLQPRLRRRNHELPGGPLPRRRRRVATYRPTDQEAEVVYANGTRCRYLMTARAPAGCSAVPLGDGARGRRTGTAFPPDARRVVLRPAGNGQALRRHGLDRCEPRRLRPRPDRRDPGSATTPTRRRRC